MTSLIERLEKATGPDRDLDCDIDSEWLQDRSDGLEAEFSPFPAYTASLDAAIALVEHVLPGWGYDFVKPAKEGPGRPRATVFLGDNLFAGEAPTPPLALLLALMRAVQNKEGG